MATSFELWHEGRFGANKVCRLDWDTDLPDEAPDELERQIAETATEHCDGFPGRQQYMVRALALAEQVGEFPFGMNATDSAITGSAAALEWQTPDMMQQGAEAFSHAGAQVSAQQMRHNEVLMRGIVELAMGQREHDKEIILGQQQALGKHAKQAMEMHELMEGMITRGQERRLTEAAYDKDQARKERLMKKMEWILPEIARRAGVPTAAITGSSASSDSGAPSKAADDFKTWILGLDTETQDKIFAVLGDDKGPELVELFQRMGQESAATETKH